MNFKIVLNIQWLFFILFYGCCSGDVGGGDAGGTGSSGNGYYNKESSAEGTRNARSAKRNATREFNDQSSVLAQLDRWLASWTGANQSQWVKEHYRFEVARKKDDSKSSPIGDFGYGVNGYADQKKWSVDDYEYKIANHRGGRQPEEEATWAEIDDKGLNGKDDRDLAEKKSKSSGTRLARKLLSIEADPVAVDDRDDTAAAAVVVDSVEASDYGVDKAGLTATTSEFNGGDDDLLLEEHKQLHSRSRRWGSRPNKANQQQQRQDRRRGRQEMDQQGRVDSRKSGRTGVSLAAAAADDTDRETIPDKSTVYRQRYPPVDDEEDETDTGKVEERDPGVPEVVKSTTVAADECDCVAKCASERVLQEAETSTEESSSDMGDNDNEMTTEEIEQEEEEEEAVDEQEEQEEESEEEEEELTTEETTSEADGTTKQREVYIDLKIGIKSVGNGSLSEDSEPLEFHKKILVKRAKVGDELRYQLGSFQQQQQQQPSSAIRFPISLVKAIYQLVDRNDNLRTHVAPRLPSRTKVLSKLSKLEQDDKKANRARQKINDQRPEPQHQRQLDSKKDSKGVDKVVAVIDALKELIQQ